MAKEADIEIIEPKYGFYQATVEIDAEDPDTGKSKKIKEVHLVDAKNPTEVETKIHEEMEGTMFEWKIVQMGISKIQYVY